MSIFPVTEFDTVLPATETVPVQTGVGRTVVKLGVGAVVVAESQPVAFASYSNKPSELNFKEKSWNC